MMTIDTRIKGLLSQLEAEARDLREVAFNPRLARLMFDFRNTAERRADHTRERDSAVQAVERAASVLAAFTPQFTDPRCKICGGEPTKFCNPCDNAFCESHYDAANDRCGACPSR